MPLESALTHTALLRIKHTMDTLTLASTSPYRKHLLIEAGFKVETCAPGVDEDAVKGLRLSPRILAETLAKKKAEAGRARSNGRWIVGSDQVAAQDLNIFAKPGTPERAFDTLLKLQGKSHQLITSVCLLGPNDVLWTTTNVTTLWMKPFDASELKAYIALDQPLNCAAAYRIEKAGIRLFSKIESSDFTAIQGLPMLELCSALDKLGFNKDF
jgi:septum formation protein